jgi:hypothetical protein
MRISIDVTFASSRGYVGSGAELRAPVVALSLGGLRRKVEALMVPVEVKLVLDRAARLERDRRRLTGRPRAGFAST